MPIEQSPIPSVSDLNREIASGAITPVDLVEGCLSAIERLEPTLKAWETIDRAGALDAAKLATQEISRDGQRSPLHGIPVGLKDIYNTRNLRTSMSSRVFANFVPEYDSAFVESLRTAGAIVLGKTVTTEFAMGDPSRTLNPWNEAHTPGGSSSGSAVAVASGMVPLASGSQTAGSVNRPAAYNGVVGLKPTYGRVSRFGVFPVSWTLDTLGWMVREVRDAAIVLDLVSGYDPRDPASVSMQPTASLLALDYEDSAWHPKIGVASGRFMEIADVETKTHLEDVVRTLRLTGATIQELAMPDSMTAINDAQLVIDYSECSQVHRETHAKRPMDYAPNVRARIECGVLIPSWAYVQAQRLRRKFRFDMEEVIGSDLDAVILPAAPSPAPRDLTNTGTPAYQAPWTTAGLPLLNIPTGLSEAGVPMAVQFIARGFEEESLLRVGRWAERELSVDLGTPPLAQQ